MLHYEPLPTKYLLTYNNYSKRKRFEKFL